MAKKISFRKYMEEIKKEILKKVPRKTLHEIFCINWQRTDLITCYEHKGKFTINRLIKEYDLNPSNMNFVIIEYKPYYSESISRGVIKIESDNKYSCIHNFYEKRTVEELRKRDNIVAYIVSVDQSATVPVSNKKFSSIWNLVREDYNSRIIVKKNALIKDGHIYHSYNVQSEVEDALDKSGYSIIDKHTKLQHKLDEIKKEKLDKVVHTAFNKENTEVFSKIMEMKDTLADKLKDIYTADDIRKLSNALSSVQSLMHSYEEHIKHLQDVTNPDVSRYYKYNSIEDVSERLGELNSRITSILSYDENKYYNNLVLNK